MTASTYEDKIIEIISAVLQLAIDANASRETIHVWDSLKHISIIFAIEDAFEIQFSEEDIPNLNSVKIIAAAIATRHAS